ncbi:MAG TPA: hypothetical protein PK819_06375, partial [Thermomicrobiales bacterium]|nr:hypothetical protein [Thermomicrobiales bacterium]
PVRSIEDTLARIGGDEFVTPLPPMELREFQQVSRAIERMAESLEQALNIRTAIWNQYGAGSGMHLFCARSISRVPLTLDPDE